MTDFCSSYNYQSYWWFFWISKISAPRWCKSANLRWASYSPTGSKWEVQAPECLKCCANEILAPNFCRKAPKSQRGSGRIVEKRSKICLLCSIFSQIEYWIHRLEETRRRSEDARGIRGIKRWMSANSLSGTQSGRLFSVVRGSESPLEIPTDFTNPYGFS